jgi:polyhydroxyalkanoate synthesis regulator phasin
MPDAWRAYLEMALGLTEAPRKRAQKVAGELVNRGGATAAQLQGLVEDLLQASMANREALTNIVRYEVDRALGVVGLATAEEVSELTTKVRDLEKQLREAQKRTTAPGEGSAQAPVKAAPSKVAKKALARKTAGPAAQALEVPADPAPAPASAPGSAPTKKAVAKKAVAKKTVAKKAVAKKAVAKKAVAKKAVAKKVAGTAGSPVAGVRAAAAATEVPAPVAPASNPAAAEVVASSQAASGTTPADDVLTESIGDDLSPTEREALRAVAGETTNAPAAPVKKTAAKKAPARKTAPQTPDPKAAPKAAQKTAATPAQKTAAKKAAAQPTAPTSTEA